MRNLVIAVFLSAVVACGIGYSFGQRASSPQTAVQESVYDRVIKSGKIRCGYVVVPPSLIRDPNTGAFSGISYDIMERLGKDLGLAIEWSEETSFAAMTEGLNRDRFDLDCAVVWSRSPRGKTAQFSIPLYYSAINAYGRADDNRFNSTQSFNDPSLTVATIDGSTSSSMARDISPLAKTYSLPDLTDFSQLMVAVTSGKADLTFSEEPQAALYLQKNPGSVKNLTPDQPLGLFANSFSMKMGEDKLAHMINNGLQNLLNVGFVDRVLEKHAAPNAYRRVSKAYQ